jgi:phage repressor protein C with HTH and peptisase S24 domain
MSEIYRTAVDDVNRISVCRLRQSRGMGESNDRLKEARVRAGFGSARSAAIRYGWTVSTYASHENGQTPVPIDAARAYAKAFKTSAAWILTGEGSSEGLYVPIVGYVGAGAEVHPFSDQGELDQGAWFDFANAATVGVRVRGDSMRGRADDGDLLYYDERRNPPTPDMSGKLCVVGLADGRVLVKQLFLGRDGTYNLFSTNADPIMDAEIEWAARVTAIVPR